MPQESEEKDIACHCRNSTWNLNGCGMFEKAMTSKNNRQKKSSTRGSDISNSEKKYFSRRFSLSSVLAKALRA